MKLLTRRKIIEIWSKPRNEEALDMPCCPNCQEILYVTDDGLYLKCENFKCNETEKYKISEIDKDWGGNGMRGELIEKTHWHDAGANGRCSYCGRYSDNIECLKKEYVCNCGKTKGYSGSFKKPNEKAIWSEKNFGTDEVLK